MKNLKSFFISTLFLLCIYDLPVASVFLPVGPAEYRFIYDAARRSEISGGFYYFNYNIAPYDLAEIQIDHPLSSYRANLNQDNIGAFVLLAEDFRSAKYSRGEGFESIRGGVMARPFERLFIYSSFLLDERTADNPEYSGKKWRGLAGEVETAFMAYSGRNFDILFGRFGSFWGPASQSLVLSSTAKPMDACSFRLRWGKLHFAYQLGKLNRLVGEADAKGIFENRYFAGHRIDLRLFDNLNIGLFETIIFGGAGRNLEFSYLNPLLFFHAVQLNEDVNDNTFLGLDICYYLGNRYKIFGQILIDDYQIDDKSQGDNEPDEVGFILGFHSLDLFDLFDLNAEYLRITNRTYNQNQKRNIYVNRGELIGHSFGPDGDRVSLSLDKWFEYKRKVSLNLSYQRKGEGRYDDEWNEPWFEVEGDYSEPFPTGVVEKTWSGSLRFAGFINDVVFLDLESGVRGVRDFAHVDGDNRTIPFFSLRFSLLFSTLLSID